MHRVMRLDSITKSFILNFIAMVITKTQKNLFLSDIIIDPQPLVKLAFKSADLPNEPYSILDFIEIANRASHAFKSKPKWIKYFDVCNSLFLSDKLDVIHRAKSVAALVSLYRFVVTLEEFYSNPYEIVYSQILPLVTEQIALHEAYKTDSVNRFITCLQQVAKFQSNYQH